MSSTENPLTLVNNNTTTQKEVTYDCNIPKLSTATEIMTWILFLIQIYVVIALFYTTLKVITMKTVRTGEEHYRNHFSRLLSVASIFILIRTFFGLDTIWLITGIQYTILKILNYITTSMAVFTLFLVLWLRQKVLYTNRITENIRSKYTAALVWILLVSMATCAIFNTIFLIYPDTYISSTFECLFHKGQSNWALLKWIVFIVSVGFFQTLLLGLFIYPLFMQRMYTKSNSQLKTSNKFYERLIRRVIYLTCVCSSTDLAATVAVLGMGSFIDNGTTDFFFLVSLFANQICVLCSFNDWKVRLFPWLPSSEETLAQRRSTYQSDRSVSHVSQNISVNKRQESVDMTNSQTT